LKSCSRIRSAAVAWTQRGIARRVAIHRRRASRGGRGGAQIDFDANGYRDARKQELEIMARKAAEKVKVTKTPFVFDPMNAQDRRIIHTALVDVQESGRRAKEMDRCEE